MIDSQMLRLLSIVGITVLLYVPAKFSHAQSGDVGEDKDVALEIYAVIKEHRDLESTKIKFSELEERLEALLAVDVELDETSLEEQGVDAETEIELSAKQRSVASALTVALEPSYMAWTIRNETLYITSIDVADLNRVTLPYDVTELVQIPESLLAFAEFKVGQGEMFVDEINREVEWMWAPLDLADVKMERSPDCVKVQLTSTWDTHLYVENYLKRRKRDLEESGNDIERDFDEKFQQVYPLLNAADADGIVASILEFALKGEAAMDTHLRKVQDGLVVDASWDNHLKVRDFLVGIGMLEKPSQGGIEGGGLFRVDGMEGGVGWPRLVK